MKEIIVTTQVENLIFELRGQKVILDSELARLYGVETKTLKRAVRRNIDRFPDDFMFELTQEEFRNLRYQFGTSSYGGTRYLPFAFTEHGAIMAASVLNTPKAVEMSVFIVRAFIRLRTYVIQVKDLAQKVKEIEDKLGKHDEAIVSIVQALQQLMQPPTPKVKEVGFKGTKSK